MHNLLLFLFFMNLLFAKAFAGNCRDDVSSLRTLNANIIKSYLRWDMTPAINRSMQAMKDCNISPRESGMSEQKLLSMLRITQQPQLAKIKTDLEEYAKTGKIDAFANEYKEYAKKMYLPEKHVESYLAQQKSIAAKSYAKEKVSCTPVDMSEGFGPVRNQDSIGWCYAFAAADLASYKLKKKVSAADIALTYNKDYFNDILKFTGRTAEEFEGGFPTSALNGAVEKGLCLEADFPSEDNANGGIKDLLGKIDTLGRQQIRASKADCDELYSASQSLFPNVTVTELQKILETSSRKDFIDKMADKTCKNRIMTNMKIESSSLATLWSKETLASTIDEQMSAKNPVLLAYDANGLGDRRDYSRRGGHASVLVARRFNEKSGQCEYLLRNSWGRSCGYYDQAYECNQGNIWIPKPDIIKRGMYATFIK